MAGQNQHSFKDSSIEGQELVDVKGDETENTEQSVVWADVPDAASMRSHIFQLSDIKEELVGIPEWGVQILVRGMNGAERGTILRGAMAPDGKPDIVKMYADFCITCCHHPIDRKRIWKEADRDELNKKSGGIIERIAMVAARLSGIDETQANAIRKN